MIQVDNQPRAITASPLLIMIGIVLIASMVWWVMAIGFAAWIFSVLLLTSWFTSRGSIWDEDWTAPGSDW